MAKWTKVHYLSFQSTKATASLVAVGDNFFRLLFWLNFAYECGHVDFGGWTQVIAEVFHVEIDSAMIEKLSRIASEVCGR